MDKGTLMFGSISHNPWKKIGAIKKSKLIFMDAQNRFYRWI